VGRERGPIAVTASNADWYTFEGSAFSEASFVRAWLVASATYGVGDVVTTIALVWFLPAYTEANPLIVLAIETFGGGGYLAVKLLVFFGCLGISFWAGFADEDRLFFYGPPALLAVVGAVSTGYNLWLLL
jgi:hypothetical protein